jgi:hypothetical protein
VASGQSTPVVGRYLDIESLGCGPDPPPRSVSFGVAHALDLIEPRDSIADMGGVAERLPAFVVVAPFRPGILPTNAVG